LVYNSSSEKHATKSYHNEVHEISTKKTNKSILKNHPDLVSNDLIFVVCFSHRTKKKQLVFFPSTGWIHEFEGLSIEKWEGDFIIKNNET